MSDPQVGLKSSAEHAQFESAAIYLAIGPSASSKNTVSLESSPSESSIMPPVLATASYSYKRAHSPEHTKADEDGPSVIPPTIRPTKRSRIRPNIFIDVHNELFILISR